MNADGVCSAASGASDCFAVYDHGTLVAGSARGIQYVSAANPAYAPVLTQIVALEVYFSRCLGFSLLAIGALTILLTGSVPLSSSLAEGTFHPSTILYDS